MMHNLVAQKFPTLKFSCRLKDTIVFVCVISIGLVQVVGEADQVVSFVSIFSVSYTIGAYSNSYFQITNVNKMYRKFECR